MFYSALLYFNSLRLKKDLKIYVIIIKKVEFDHC
ncbi:Uncharacterised protein [Photobacterium damselae]|uniref:Uncharacterized protein n=1 Tax=Photobacterium damselae TaxID=38293 RepID=A0A2X1WZV4_PHODM|nr:Uncharacterised protein [Photobacterium damselae]